MNVGIEVVVNVVSAIGQVVVEDDVAQLAPEVVEALSTPHHQHHNIYHLKWCRSYAVEQCGKLVWIICSKLFISMFNLTTFVVFI